MKIQVHDSNVDVDVADTVFGCEFNEALVHQTVVAYMAGGRAGTKAQKTRAQVRGGGKKPWKQKGSGRARAGTIRSPLWRSGGIIFAASPRDHSQKVNRKMYRGAMRAIFSELVRQDRLLVVDSIPAETPRTRALLDRLRDLGATDALIVTDAADLNLYLAARNLYRVDVSEVNDIDPLTLVHRDKVVITVPALKRVEEWLA